MILISYGTRPEYLKVKPVMDELDKNEIEYETLFTGQHLDLIKDVEVNQHITIQDGVNRLDAIVGSIMNGIDFRGIDYVMVQGDTSSAFAVALSAFHNGVKIIHLEAGLRTYDNDNPYPEEINRKIISQIADVHLCPTIQNMENLANERIDAPSFVVGNTGLDNLVSKKYYSKYKESNNVLVTLHRRENLHWMKEWFQIINEIAKKYPNLNFIFPVHPNPNVQLHKRFIDAENIQMIEPLEHNELLDVIVRSKLVITDSGGIQEECSFFNKICLTCRKVTERPEAIDKSTIMVETPLALPHLFDKYIKEYDIDYECPFGDGHSSEKVVKILKELI